MAPTASCWPTAFGSFQGDANYAVAADLDANGVIAAADRQLSYSNYGFTAGAAMPAFPNYFTVSTGTVWSPLPVEARAVAQAARVADHRAGSSGGTALQPDADGHAAHDPDARPSPTGAANQSVFRILPMAISRSRDRPQPGFGWTVRGQVTVASGTATLHEGGQVNTALTQAFFIPGRGAPR